MKRINQLLFGAVLFAGCVSVLTALVYILVAGLILLTLEFVLFTSLYVLIYSFVVSLLFFSLSMFRKNGYLILGAAALPINILLGQLFFRGEISLRYWIVVFLSSLVTIALGEIIYRKIWLRLDEMLSE